MAVNGYLLQQEEQEEDKEEEEAGTGRPDYAVWLNRAVRFAESSSILGAHQLCFPL